MSLGALRGGSSLMALIREKTQLRGNGPALTGTPMINQILAQARLKQVLFSRFRLGVTSGSKLSQSSYGVKYIARNLTLGLCATTMTTATAAKNGLGKRNANYDDSPLHHLGKRRSG